ncbi:MULTISPECIES: FAD/NAD(P)-binding protein [Actinoalloteichus]|uniref:FAD-NAD(P)-binding n=1 Tax=Actinoalloteichus fjordicus TaxID=1612552 RepID=A0AAC9PSX3_9PSEU|nr:MULTISPECIES: FAD/NAD(P)-binding protein [Actinoalloteichus]APU15457.1 FAD-NAD(P)-binding [Actinoalloteichus fjordicus]APU21525.1 FAD-NAD(P)-binding [Actinoalloteichus sp. GBA129-24]
MRIAVIGAGPRGLSVLERVVSHTRLPGPATELLLIEPGEPGVGVHDVKQPDYLLLNTIAAQLTIFSDEHMTPGAPVTTGPSLHEWCLTRHGPVRFDDYLPRRLLGEYLQWAVRDLLARVPPRLTVRHLPAVARDVRQAGSGAVVTLADGTTHEVDLAVVTTGHGLAAAEPAAGGALVATPYPLPARVEGIAEGATVALRGSGLTAMDVIAGLTVGRGGVFGQDGYTPSGREPHIVLANRTGLLPCARPRASRGRLPAPATHLTPAAITRLRERVPGGLLDFRRDVEPLIRREALARLAAPGPPTYAEIAAVDRALSPVPGTWATYAEYRDATLALARADLAEAERGLGVSPVKEALEVLRDHRESLRVVVDPPGLTEESHRYFLDEYVPLVNRVVIGPQKERLHELLALTAAGIVTLGPGPGAVVARAGDRWALTSTGLGEPRRVEVDAVVRANLTWPAPDDEKDPVGSALRTWVAAGDDRSRRLTLDRDGYVIRRDGEPCTAIAVFGPPAEGASYYNHYVPSPGRWSRALTDLDRVLVPVLSAKEAAMRAAP